MTGQGPSKRLRIVVLTPVYNEEESLPLYEKTVTEVLLSQREYEFEILFIDDGSTDRSWEMIRTICVRDSRFRGIRLSRNFGSHIALTAGFARADGDATVILACDLQDPPETLLELAKEWQGGAKIVWGHRRSRKDHSLRVLASKAFIWLIRRFAMPGKPKFATGSFLLIDKQVLQCYRQFHECNRVTFALVAWTGFEQAIVEYDRKARIAGKSGWNFGQMLKAMYDTFVGFSFLPIRMMTLAGAVAFLCTIFLSGYYLYCWLTHVTPPGYTSLIITLTFFFGIQFVFMGITGEYLYRIYSESVRRPLYFISEKTGTSNPGNSYDQA